MAYQYGQALGRTAGNILGSFIPVPGASIAGTELGGYVGSYFDQPENNQKNPGQNQDSFSFFNQPKQQFSPEQQNLQKQSIQQLMALLQGGPQQEAKGFEPFAERARNQFQSRIIPTIAERFTAMGGQSGGSSALQPYLQGAGADLEAQLAALGSQYGQNQYFNKFNMLSPLATTPQLSEYTHREPGFGENTLNSILPILTLLAGLYGGNKLDKYFNPQEQTQPGKA